MNKLLKKIIAREALLLVVVILTAWLLTNMSFYRTLIYNTGLCGISNADGLRFSKMASNNFDLEVRLRTELVEGRIHIYGFAFILLGYLLIRFIIWAVKTLRKK